MADKASFQVIVLGPTGGPREDSVTGLLVRSTSRNWSSNSVIAVDAGTLLAGIIRTLDLYIDKESDEAASSIEKGPFAGLNLPFKTAQANAAHLFRDIIGAVLVTHPHLDHLAGLAINTPILEAGNGPKKVAALPSVIAAIKNHMFNDIIWPNLSDEDGGAGLLTYQRMVEGGNPRFGRGESRGYVQACDGLLAKCLGISHGRCRQRDLLPDTAAHHRLGSTVFTAESLMLPSRAISVDHTEGTYVTEDRPQVLPAPALRLADPSMFARIYSPARSPRLLASNTRESAWVTVESSAFFIRDYVTGHEIIVFGDVEPDSVSQDPRNKLVWEVAAPKIAAGSLKAIFIECSFNDSVDDNSLYGHLCPRHLIAELTFLAGKVAALQQSSRTGPVKRKREDASPPGRSTQVSPKSKRAQSIGAGYEANKANALAASSASSPGRRSARSHTRSRLSTRDDAANLSESVSESATSSGRDVRADAAVAEGDEGEGENEVNDPNVPSYVQWSDSTPPPLADLAVYIIHVKDHLSDGPPPGDQILEELRAHGEATRLGCSFHVPHAGEGIFI